LPFLLFLKSKYNHYRKAKKMTSSASSLKNIRTLIVLLLNSRNLQNMMKKANNLQTISKSRLAKNTLIISILLIKSDKSYTFITFSTSSWSMTPRCLGLIDSLLSMWGWFTLWLLVLSIQASILNTKWLPSQSSTALLSLQFWKSSSFSAVLEESER